LPGLSGDEGACVKFLQRLKIPLKSPGSGKPRTVSDLTKDEKSTLISAIIENSLKHGMNPNKVKGLIGNVYVLEQEDPATNLKDLREFASMLNSCGRQDAGGVGLAIAMGDRGEIFQEGQQLINEYRKKLSHYIEWVQAQGPIKKRDSLQIIEGGDYIDDAMIGTIVSILMSSKNVTKDLPIIGWAKIKSDPSVIKISARGFQELVDKGLNLGAAIKETVKELDIDTPGGGHAPAAGAEIPEAKLDRFIKGLGKHVAAQLHLDGEGTATAKKAQSWF
jgi:RecJ-like exonuclease